MSDCGQEDNSEEEYLSADEGSDADGSKEGLPSENIDPVNSSVKQLDVAVGDKEDNDEDEEESSKGEEEEEEDERWKLEELLSLEEKEERKAESQKLKDEGNARFRQGEYSQAVDAYTEALAVCPLTFLKERSIMFSNRAACKMKEENFDSAIQDSSKALKLHPTYLKALLRRAELYERTEKLDESLTDYQKVLELDPSNGMARAACMRLPQQIKDRNEKMKEEMIGKLKDLGNLVLRPFGLSTNNFKLQQDENTGSYSVQFQQNPPGNGT